MRGRGHSYRQRQRSSHPPRWGRRGSGPTPSLETALSWGPDLLAVTGIVCLRGTTARACVWHCPRARHTRAPREQQLQARVPGPGAKRGLGSLRLGAKSLGHSKPGEVTHAARHPGGGSRTQTQTERRETAARRPGPGRKAPPGRNVPERARADTATSRTGGATRPVTGAAGEPGRSTRGCGKAERGRRRPGTVGLAGPPGLCAATCSPPTAPPARASR